MKKKLLFIVSIISLAFLFLANTNTFAQEEPAQKEKSKPRMGLSIRPGGLLIQYVKLGEAYDLYKKTGIVLIIENKDSRPHTYLLSTSKPSQVGNKKWLKGYLEIPSPDWFWFEKDEVTVGAESQKEIKMFLKIPKEDKYYNQHWTVSLGVTGKPKKGEVVALAVYPRYQIETESKTVLTQRPYGTIGLEPSLLKFENLTLGEKKKGTITIYNNSNKTHRYAIIPRIVEVGPGREKISSSPGYAWIPNIKWIKPGKKRINIGTNKSKELPIRVKIPEKLENYDKNWEAILFVEPDKGLPGFIRVQIKTEKVKE